MCVQEAASHANNVTLSSFLWLEEAIVLCVWTAFCCWRSPAPEGQPQPLVSWWLCARWKKRKDPKLGEIKGRTQKSYHDFPPSRIAQPPASLPTRSCPGLVLLSRVKRTGGKCSVPVPLKFWEAVNALSGQRPASFESGTCGGAGRCRMASSDGDC